MKGYVLNPDKEYTQKIMEGILRKNGHCPCQVKEDDTTLCPCDRFVETKHCCCNLFIKEEE